MCKYRKLRDCYIVIMIIVSIIAIPVIIAMFATGFVTLNIFLLICGSYLFIVFIGNFLLSKITIKEDVAV